MGSTSDRGSLHLSIRYSEQLDETGIEPSVGSKGDSYDNALAETINGPTKRKSHLARFACGAAITTEVASPAYCIASVTGLLSRETGTKSRMSQTAITMRAYVMYIVFQITQMDTCDTHTRFGIQKNTKTSPSSGQGGYSTASKSLTSTRIFTHRSN